MTRKEEIEKEIETLHAELRYHKIMINSSYGGSVKNSTKHIEKFQKKRKEIVNEIVELEAKLHNSIRARDNMREVESVVYDLMKGLCFAMTSNVLNLKGRYKYKMTFNIKINVEYIKNYLAFLKTLYKAKIFVDEYTVYVEIHPKELNKEFLDKNYLNTYNESNMSINKFNL